MITFVEKGNHSKTRKFLEKLRLFKLSSLDTYAKQGVIALSSATPVDTGLTAKSWIYKISQTKSDIRISFYNTNIQNGVPIAIILQYGHATRNGGWVQGRDYINPAIRPVFDKIADSAWKEVTRL